MANKLAQEKIDAMWAAFLEKQSIHHVSQKCRVSRKTVARYRTVENWDERLKEIQERSRKKSDETIADRRARSKKILDAAVAQIGKMIVGEKMKYTAGDLERLVRLQEWFDGLPDRTEGAPCRRRPRTSWRRSSGALNRARSRSGPRRPWACCAVTY